MLMTLMIAAGLAGAPDASTLNQPRMNYRVCLKIFSNKSAEAKMHAADFEQALGAACTGEATRYSKAMVDYDVGTGSKRAAAEANAKAEIDDARSSTLEGYRRIAGEAK